MKNKEDEYSQWVWIPESTVSALIPLTADQGCWKRENKINVKSRKEETCDVHKCIVLYFACYSQEDL